MPLPLPNLDDRTYDDLVAEARALIPTHAPEWTNHNPSDPGITLVEMFAYLTEMMIYRLNRVTDANMLAFLRLLNGPAWSPEKSLAEEVRQTVLQFRQPNRAVTCADFENLALAADAGVARARCLPRRDLESENALAPSVDKPGHISVVIVPRNPDTNLTPSTDLIQTVRDYLEPRRLLTTWVHVVGPRTFGLAVRLTLVRKTDAVVNAVRAQVETELKEFFHPLAGGSDGEGWPFGRDVYVSEIYELLDRLPGVDYVTKTVDLQTQQPLDELIVSPADNHRLVRNAQGDLIAVRLEQDELVDIDIQKTMDNLTLPELIR